MTKMTSIIGILMGVLTTATAASIPTGSSAAAAAALGSLGVSPPSGNVLIGNAGYTCSLLNRVLSKNETFTVTSPYYDVLIDEAWSENCRLNASCIVTPESAEEVSRLLQILSILETRFAIRSGGHNTNPGFSSIGSDGVLIALEKLDSISLSADRGTVTVGPGNKWESVYKYLQPYNLTALGGREAVVGVGGYILGETGGLSTFYNTHGLAIDSVTRFQVVLPNGTIVDATPTEHADLYKGLKGGLNNFGIVTEYDLTTNTGVDIYYEIKTYTTANTPAVLAAYATYLLDADINSNVEIQINPSYTLVFYGYLGHVSAPTDFDPFSDIPVASTMYPPTNGSLTELLLSIGSTGLTSEGVSYSGTFSFKVTGSTFLQDTYSTYLEAAASLPTGAVLSYVPQGVIPNLVTQGKSQNGGNLLGLDATPQVWANIFVQFPATLSQSEVAGSVDSLLANLISSAKSEDLFLPYIFVNDAGAKQKPLQSFGEKNIKYIDTVAKRYDPKRIMQRLQNQAYFVLEEL
uniref:FAD-dependent monooxygenase macF n=1 Tax=Penicillium terrestre TaxID=374132 RepID=MACF_PENTR|nr:RecName: Full=FAD-dependent monooxygenase macF; AltName: Full=Macrophorins biosynthesis cluster protein F; Flags: Precursor [Penicillium terrestre]AVK70106.1 MacF [Penicillium terrestre]QBC75442.1 MacF [Penicillium terrestre]